jgi:hypothetical protein
LAHPFYRFRQVPFFLGKIDNEFIEGLVGKMLGPDEIEERVFCQVIRMFLDLHAVALKQSRLRQQTRILRQGQDLLLNFLSGQKPSLRPHLVVIALLELYEKLLGMGSDLRTLPCTDEFLD